MKTTFKMGMMKNKFKFILPLVIVLFTACKNNQKMKNIDPKSALVFPQGEKITNDNFIGTAYLQMLIEADTLSQTSVGNVTFEPGARTKWHSHPAGQILLVTAGMGYYQEQGQSKKILHKGDVIKCPAGVVHWHGASKDAEFVQLAITDTKNGAPVWLEHVTDKEYLAN